MRKKIVVKILCCSIGILLLGCQPAEKKKDSKVEKAGLDNDKTLAITLEAKDLIGRWQIKSKKSYECDLEFKEKLFVSFPLYPAQSSTCYGHELPQTVQDMDGWPFWEIEGSSILLYGDPVHYRNLKKVLVARFVLVKWGKVKEFAIPNTDIRMIKIEH